MKSIFVVTLLLIVVWTKGLQGCQFNEVAVILDVSGTVFPLKFYQSKEFVNKVLSEIKITPDANSSRVSVVTFTSVAEIRIYCDENLNTSLEQAIYALTHDYSDPFTNVKDGLVKGRLSLATRGCGRTNAKKIMILISDGRANRGAGGFEAIRQVAKEIREEGGTIIALGVGDRINTDILKNITGNETLVLTSQTLDDQILEKTLKIFTEKKCKAESPPRICACKVPSSLVNMSAIPLNEVGISTLYNGRCYLEKIEKATEETNTQYKKYIEYNETNQICKSNLKNMIRLTSSGGEEDLLQQQQQTEQLFKNYDECIHVECSMRSAGKILAQKKSFLNQETNCVTITV